jgi:membrane protein
LVPLLTVMLAVFTAFPMFGKFQQALQTYFLQSLVPDAIAKPVLASLTQFASKAHRLGAVGLLLLVVSALSLMLTIDRSLNAIWRVRKPRPIAQRVLVYWSTATLGPLLLGVSLTLTSYVFSASQGLIGALPDSLSIVLDLIEVLVLAGGMAGLYHYVPNTHVRWRYALAGGVFAALGFEVAKRALAWYVGSTSSFSTIYGAFATVPIFLLWLYLSWVIVLMGAVITAYAPSLQMRVVRQASTPGHHFALALQVLGELAARLRIDPLQIEPVVDLLIAQDWVGQLEESGAQRLVLLCDPQRTPAARLIDTMLLRPDERVRMFRERAGLDRLLLIDLLPV